jgi:hypothetical protein
MPRHKSKFGWITKEDFVNNTTRAAAPARAAPAAGAAGALVPRVPPTGGAGAGGVSHVPATTSKPTSPWLFRLVENGIVFNPHFRRDSVRAMKDSVQAMKALTQDSVQALGKTTLKTKFALAFVLAETFRVAQLGGRRWEQVLTRSNVQFYEDAISKFQRDHTDAFKLFRFVLFCTYRANERKIGRLAELMANTLSSPTNLLREVSNGLDAIVHGALLPESSFAAAVHNITATSGDVTASVERTIMSTNIGELLGACVAMELPDGNSTVEAVKLFEREVGVPIMTIYNEENTFHLKSFMTEKIRSQPTWTGVSDWAIFALLAASMWLLYSFFKSNGGKGKITTASPRRVITSFGRRRTKKDKKRSQRK